MIQAPDTFIIKNYGLVIYGLRSKLVCLTKLVKVTDSRKDISLPGNLSIFVNYESVMFYGTGPRRIYYKNFQGGNCGAVTLSITTQHNGLIGDTQLDKNLK